MDFFFWKRPHDAYIWTKAKYDFVILVIENAETKPVIDLDPSRVVD